MSSSNSGPAIMMMPPNIRATFMPDPPLRPLPAPTSQRRRTKIYMDLPDLYEDEDAEDGEEKEDSGGRTANETQSWPKCKMGITGVSAYIQHFDKGPKKVKESIPKAKVAKQLLYEQQVLEPLRLEYRSHQKECAGEYMGMNCYKTLFVGRLAYEVTERKLLREMEAFGPIKDVRLIFKKDPSEQDSGIKNDVATTKKSRGYAFIEYEHEEDMKRAYRAADGMRVEGREIVVDVERGHTVPNWFPRRLGGGLGGTRLGGRDVNVTYPGRFDPTKTNVLPPLPIAPYPSGSGGRMMMMPPGPGPYGGGGGPPPSSFNGPPPPGDRPGGHYPPSRGSFDDRRGPSRRFDDRSSSGGGGGGGRDYSGGAGGYGRPGPPSDNRLVKRGRSRSPSPGRSRDSRRGRY